jgi:PTH1 family peptidyl-tRNA hydrolase
MRLIVGLGNPGARYRGTPHNAGFLACDRLAERHGLGDETRKFQGLFRRGRIHGEDIALLKPQTYMNLSGDSVAEAVRYLPLEPCDVILVFDEIDLPQGKIRIRKDGGHGGHNGTRSVIERLGSREFSRVRIGVGRPQTRRDPTGHLLSKVRTGERERFSDTIDLAVEALCVLLADGVDEAMNRYNGRPAVGEEESGTEEGEGKS